MKGFIDYHRTIVGYHGTNKARAEKIVQSQQFTPSTNLHDWLGHGVYYWEHAPKQALWWARNRYGAEAAVVASMIRLGNCLDLLDPENAEALGRFHDDLALSMQSQGKPLPVNAGNRKLRDKAVLESYYSYVQRRFGQEIESTRAMYLRPSPIDGSSAGEPLWRGTWLCHYAHVQICIRPNAVASCTLGTWPVKIDGSDGV